jgi:ADP-heptose:LPS heptosyltransferase
MVIENIKNILVINLGGIGDVLLSLPALKALRKLYPSAIISMLVVNRVYEIIEDSPYLDKIFIFYVGYGGKLPLKKLLTNLKTLWLLRKKKLDLAINMRTLVSKKSARKIKFLFNIINPRIKVGRDTQARGDFFDIKIPETDKGDMYEAKYDIDTVRALGAQDIDETIDFKINEKSMEEVNQILKKEGLWQEDILIGIHYGGRPASQWPIENFSRVIQEIGKKINCKFVITGGKEEARLGEKLVKITDIQIINLVAKFNIQQLAALIKRCNLFISTDTAPMHIAAILKTPLVAIFGPGSLVRFDPRNISDKVVVIYKKVDCSPCNKIKCESLECLKNIYPEEVISAASSLIKSKLKH